MAVFTTAAIIGAVSAGAFAAIGTGITIAGVTFTGISAGLLVGGASLALSAASTLLAPKPKIPTYSPISTNLTQQVKQAITSRKMVYGACRVSGPITYVSTSDGTRSASFPGGVTRNPSNNELLHMCVPLAGHEVEAIGTVYLNDVAIHPDALDGSGFVTAGDYNNNVRLHKYLGTASQNADTDLIAEAGDVDSNFRGRGVAYIYARYQYASSVFTSGLPNLSCQVYGRKVYDPRDAQTRWSPNAALCWRDYMTATFGMRATADEIDDDYVVAAANACEEIVTTKNLVATVDGVNTTQNWLTTDQDVLEFETGDRVQISSTGAIPGGLSALTNYYVIVAHYTADPAVKLATSYANALAGVAIDLTDAGSGTITLTKNGEPRFTCNGVVDTENRPVDILTNLLGSMGGRAVYSGGKWRLYAAVWMAPTVFLDQDDLVAEVVTQTRHSRRDLFNAVQGTYIAASNLGQATNYPAVTNAFWQAQDGEQIFSTLDFPFTNRFQTCQRLAKIELERHRRQISLDLTTSLSGMMCQAGENMGLDFPNNGWVEKAFEIVTWVLNVTGSGDNGVTFGVNMSLREVDAGCFEFDETTDEVQPTPAPATNLPNPFFVGPPTNLVLTSGTAALYRKDDGTVVSRIRATWDAANDGLVQRYELNYKEAADTTWQTPAFVTAGTLEHYIWDAKDGTSYDVRVRAVNTSGIPSAWAVPAAGSHTVVGKTEPPSDVPSLFAQQNGQLTNAQWTQVTDADLAAYELRYGPYGDFVWDEATILTLGAGAGQVARGTGTSSGSLPPGDWTLGIKAVDTSGNYSANAATYDVTILNQNTLLLSRNEEAAWLGDKVNLVKHDVSGRLVIQSQDADSAGNNFNVFDTFVLNPYANGTYTAPEFDAGVNLFGVRVFAEITAALGPGVTGDGPASQLQIDYHLDGDPYDGYENWQFGSLNLRNLKSRVTVDATMGALYISHFRPTVDAVKRTESGVATVDASGNPPIVFSQPFFSTPAIQITPASGGLVPFYDNQSGSGFTMHLENAAGTEVGGTASWTVEGI